MVRLVLILIPSLCRGQLLLIIKSPVSLDKITRKLTEGEYTSLDEVKHDVDTSLRNANMYNVKGSRIWLDAKALHVSVYYLSPFVMADYCMRTSRKSGRQHMQRSRESIMQ